MIGKTSKGEIRILYAATYYVRDYVRQSVLLEHVRRLPNVSVDVLLVNRRGWTRYFEFLWKFLWLKKGEYQAIYLGWRTIEVAPLLRVMTRRPIIFDAFVPIFETLCYERKRVSPRSVIGRFVHWWEGLALRSVNHVVTDTKANAQYFSEEYHLDPVRCVDIPVGVDRSIYSARPNVVPPDKTRVFFYGTFLPLHGTRVMIEAAHLLRDRVDIVWQFVGNGPERLLAETLANKHRLSNVTFIPRAPQSVLAQKISEADICLGGPFSNLPKAQRVITGKTYQFLAMGKPVIVSDTAGNCELLTHKKNCYMVDPNNPQALAEAVRVLADGPAFRLQLGEAAKALSSDIDRRIDEQLGRLIEQYAT